MKLQKCHTIVDCLQKCHIQSYNQYKRCTHTIKRWIDCWITYQMSATACHSMQITKPTTKRTIHDKTNDQSMQNLTELVTALELITKMAYFAFSCIKRLKLPDWSQLSGIKQSTDESHNGCSSDHGESAHVTYVATTIQVPSHHRFEEIWYTPFLHQKVGK